MNIEQQIENHIAGQPESKRNDMQQLHNMIQQAMPGAKLWFLEGKDNEGKTVYNTNIGYGEIIIKYANGSTREFYKMGMSANTTGISVYIMGIDDKKYLANTYGEKIGKASVTGYCIKFKTLKDINVAVLEEAIRDAATQQ